jgi:hypothetical protein
MNSSSTERSEIRRFGIIAFLFFGALLAIAIWRQKVIVTPLFGALSALGLGFVLLPGTLKPVYRGWLKIAHLIGRMVTTIILTMAYYLVMTPSAWLKRLFGGKPLPMSPDREAGTYWVDREEPVQPKERFFKRY